jgi:hypothetical protein
MRQKDAPVVLAEAAAFIHQGGYRELSLSSLSTGDYGHIGPLLEALNQNHAASHVSFQLPSLRVSTFSLPILEKVSAVRRSGLTFAVETPVDAWQLAINKEVSRDSVVAILREARKNGWRGAKFYFMIGLPPGGTPADGAGHGQEEEEIVGFIRDVAQKTGMNFNINVGTFIPKPHTPYQWAAQIGEEAARQKLEYIRQSLRAGGHKVGIQDPFVSVLEGFISRGDERVGGIIEEAFNQGCRLDAWDDYIKKDIWRAIFDRERPLVASILGERPLPQPEEPEPLWGPLWGGIESGTSLGFLVEEARRSAVGLSTPPCKEACDHPCGICPEQGRVAANKTAFPEKTASAPIPTPTLIPTPTPAPPPVPELSPPERPVRDPETHRILFSFSKRESAVWLPHLALIEIFAMALIRSGIPALFTRGFNPLPRLDFASPISIGVSAHEEIATLDTEGFFDAQACAEALNAQLPEGFRVNQARNLYIPSGAKKHSAASLLWGFAYAPSDYVRAPEEKQYRQGRIAAGESLFDLQRLSVLARSPGPGWEEKDGVSYFEAYQALYGAI